MPDVLSSPQLVMDLDLDPPPVRQLDDVIAHSGNQMALTYLFPDAASKTHVSYQRNTPTYPVILVGSGATGKTTLARVWLARTGGKLFSPTVASEDEAKALSPPQAITEPSILSTDCLNLSPSSTGPKSYAIDNLEAWLGPEDPSLGHEKFLFHLFNHCKNNNINLLMTASTSPQRLVIHLPDLASRLRSCVTLFLSEPNDEDRYILLAKFFSDLQLKVDDAILTTMITHGPRDIQTMQHLVKELHTRVCHTKKKISLPMVRNLLKKQVS